MGSHQVLMMKDKLSFSGIIKESLKLISPRFIFLTFITSFPYFCLLLFLDTDFLRTFILTIKSKLADPNYEHPFQRTAYVYRISWQPRPIDVAKGLIQEVFLPFLLPSLAYYGIVHLLHLFNTVATVYSASMVYSGEETVDLKEMLCRPFRKVDLKGPFITSIYGLILTSLTSMGILSLSTHFFVTSGLFKAAFGLVIIALFVKYIEWSAVWNMGMVISILEEKHGDVAIGVSAYISRGSRKRGFLLMLVLFFWWIALKLMWVYAVWTKNKSLVTITVGEVSLICLENMVKWVVLTVYFYDCKKRFLEKKADVEQGRPSEKVPL